MHPDIVLVSHWFSRSDRLFADRMLYSISVQFLIVYVICFNNPEVNRLPLSVMISRGIPCSLTIFWGKRVANCYASRSFLHGIKWLILVRRSMTTSIVSYSSDFGRSVIKCIAIDRQGWSGTSFGCNTP